MHPTGPNVELSLDRSRLRTRTLILLSSLGEARPRQLARAVGIDCQRLSWLMRGKAPRYSEELALVRLDLAREEIRSDGARLYVVTQKGRRKARMLTARIARRAERRARREQAGAAPPLDDALARDLAAWPHLRE